MSYLALAMLLDRLRQDTAIKAYFAANYPGKTIFYLIGLQPDFDSGTAVPIDHFPFLAVTHDYLHKDGKFANQREIKASILFGINDDRVLDGVYLGFKAICELSELIFAALQTSPIGKTDTLTVTWDGTADLRTDEGMLEPYYQGDLQLKLKVRLL